MSRQNGVAVMHHSNAISNDDVSSKQQQPLQFTLSLVVQKVPLLQSMVRSKSMQTVGEKKKFQPYTEREFEIFAERHRASSSSNLSSLADLSTSASSDLYRLGSLS